MTELLIDKVWISIVLCLVLSIMEHYLGLYEVYLYYNHVNAYMIFEGRCDGYERFIEPGNRKWIPSTSFMVVLAILSLGIYAGWFALVKQFGRPEIFSFLVGGIILYRATRSLIHFRMISFFRFAQDPGEIQGKVKYSRRLTFTLPYLDLYGFTLLYLLLFFIQGSWFLLGGILTCFIAARRHRDWVMVKTYRD
ncbi:MAG: hypothetical protein A2Z14_01945 [Chloroflexi bacterium RBG_16_48_8]|nr:MAG: hypothetical protein A2Z14_01945 [Chloroflexi bacterium RBG_16_48_8]